MGRHSFGRQLLALSLALLLVSGGLAVAVQTGMVEQDDAGVGTAEAGFVSDTFGGVANIATAAATGLNGFAVGLFTAGGDVAEQEEALQQKIDLFQLAATQKENSGIIRTQARNSLQGSDTLLKMEAMNALTRAAKNDTSLSDANARITERIDNRTTVKEINVFNAWSAAATNAKYIENVSDNSSGISESFADPAYSVSIPEDYSGSKWSSASTVQFADHLSDWTRNVTLANGSDATVSMIPFTVTEGWNPQTSQMDPGDYSGTTGESETVWIGPGQSEQTTTFTATFYGSEYTQTVTLDYQDYVVTRNESTTADDYLTQSGDLRFANATKYGNVLADIDQQNNEATQAVTDLAAAEYSGLRDGSIPINETITPYYADHLYSLEGNDSTPWLLNMEAAMGAANPADLDTITTMEINHSGELLQGMLMSDGLPENDTFHVGTEYDPANLTGNQFVITTDGAKAVLDNPFVIESIETPNGNVSSVTYEKPTYNVTSIQGFREFTDYLMDKRAESEAREKQAESSGGALFDFGGIGGVGLGLGLGGLGAFLMLAAVVLLALSASPAGSAGMVLREVNRRRRDD